MSSWDRLLSMFEKVGIKASPTPQEENREEGYEREDTDEQEAENEEAYLVGGYITDNGLNDIVERIERYGWLFFVPDTELYSQDTSEFENYISSPDMFERQKAFNDNKVQLILTDVNNWPEGIVTRCQNSYIMAKACTTYYRDYCVKRGKEYKSPIDQVANMYADRIEKVDAWTRNPNVKPLWEATFPVIVGDHQITCHLLPVMLGGPDYARDTPQTFFEKISELRSKSGLHLHPDNGHTGGVFEAIGWMASGIQRSNYARAAEILAAAKPNVSRLADILLARNSPVGLFFKKEGDSETREKSKQRIRLFDPVLNRLVEQVLGWATKNNSGFNYTTAEDNPHVLGTVYDIITARMMFLDDLYLSLRNLPISPYTDDGGNIRYRSPLEFRTFPVVNFQEIMFNNIENLVPMEMYCLDVVCSLMNSNERNYKIGSTYLTHASGPLILLVALLCFSAHGQNVGALENAIKVLFMPKASGVGLSYAQETKPLEDVWKEYAMYKNKLPARGLVSTFETGSNVIFASWNSANNYANVSTPAGANMRLYFDENSLNKLKTLKGNFNQDIAIDLANPEIFTIVQRGQDDQRLRFELNIGEASPIFTPPLLNDWYSVGSMMYPVAYNNDFEDLIYYADIKESVVDNPDSSNPPLVIDKGIKPMNANFFYVENGTLKEHQGKIPNMEQYVDPHKVYCACLVPLWHLFSMSAMYSTHELAGTKVLPCWTREKIVDDIHFVFHIQLGSRTGKNSGSYDTSLSEVQVNMFRYVPGPLKETPYDDNLFVKMMVEYYQQYVPRKTASGAISKTKWTEDDVILDVKTQLRNRNTITSNNSEYARFDGIIRQYNLAVRATERSYPFDVLKRQNMTRSERGIISKALFAYLNLSTKRSELRYTEFRTNVDSVGNNLGGRVPHWIIAQFMRYLTLLHCSPRQDPSKSAIYEYMSELRNKKVHQLHDLIPQVFSHAIDIRGPGRPKVTPRIQELPEGGFEGGGGGFMYSNVFEELPTPGGYTPRGYTPMTNTPGTSNPEEQTSYETFSPSTASTPSAVITPRNDTQNTRRSHEIVDTPSGMEFGNSSDVNDFLESFNPEHAAATQIVSTSLSEEIQAYPNFEGQLQSANPLDGAYLPTVTVSINPSPGHPRGGLAGYREIRGTGMTPDYGVSTPQDVGQVQSSPYGVSTPQDIEKVQSSPKRARHEEAKGTGRNTPFSPKSGQQTPQHQPLTPSAFFNSPSPAPTPKPQDYGAQQTGNRSGEGVAPSPKTLMGPPQGTPRTPGNFFQPRSPSIVGRGRNWDSINEEDVKDVAQPSSPGDLLQKPATSPVQNVQSPSSVFGNAQSPVASPAQNSRAGFFGLKNPLANSATPRPSVESSSDALSPASSPSDTPTPGTRSFIHFVNTSNERVQSDTDIKHNEAVAILSSAKNHPEGSGGMFRTLTRAADAQRPMDSMSPAASPGFFTHFIHRANEQHNATTQQAQAVQNPPAPSPAPQTPFENPYTPSNFLNYDQYQSSPLQSGAPANRTESIGTRSQRRMPSDIETPERQSEIVQSPFTVSQSPQEYLNRPADYEDFDLSKGGSQTEGYK